MARQPALLTCVSHVRRGGPRHESYQQQWKRAAAVGGRGSESSVRFAEGGNGAAHALLHGGEERVWGDAGYQGVGKREENRDAAVEWQVAMRPGQRRRLDKEGPEEEAERRKASVRAKVEHPFLYVKRHFGYAKVRYRGLAKNTQRIAVLLGFSNLLIAGRYAVA